MCYTWWKLEPEFLFFSFSFLWGNIALERYIYFSRSPTLAQILTWVKMFLQALNLTASVFFLSVAALFWQRPYVSVALGSRYVSAVLRRSQAPRRKRLRSENACWLTQYLLPCLSYVSVINNSLVLSKCELSVVFLHVESPLGLSGISITLSMTSALAFPKAVHQLHNI